MRARTQVLADPAEVQRTLEQFVSESPAAARYLLGWDADHDRIADADFSLIIQTVVMIRFIKR